MRTAWIAVTTLVAVGCSSIPVDADYDTTTDFAAIRTWAWYSESAPEGMDDLTNGRVRAAIEAELPARGLSRAAPGAAPDVLVAYQVTVAQRVESDPVAVSVGYGCGGGFGAVGTGNEVRTYDEGTLFLDLVAPARKTLVWRGTARRTLSRDSSPEERETRIREAVRAILEQYPPGK